MASGKPKMFETKIDFDKKTRQKLVKLLNQQLADTSDLYSQTKQAHWNVKGIHFLQLHEFFDEVATAVFPFVDTLAERVTALGGYAEGTVRMAAQGSSLPEFPEEAVAGHEHLEALIARFAAYAKANREAIAAAGELGDPTTEDLFTEISREVDKQLYFLESHLQGGGVKAP
jgi:starvation-inducible DNA-binding protein